MTDSDDVASSDLAASIRDYRDELQRLDDRTADHMAKVRDVADIADDLDTILTDHDAQAPDLELVVEFTQRFTVRPPDDITDPVHAEDWFWNIYPDLGRDVVDPRSKDHYDVVAVRPRGELWD